MGEAVGEVADAAAAHPLLGVLDLSGPRAAATMALLGLLPFPFPPLLVQLVRVLALQGVR